MLSKNNKILIGCLALLLVMSVGYALFSDTITINGTATAKGEFDITTTCQPGILSDFGTVESLGLYKEGGYQNDTCSVVDDTISVNTEFLYPGAMRYFTIKFTNTGTIDALYDASARTDIEQICVADNKEGNNKECESQENANSTIYLGDYRANTVSGNLGIVDPNGKILTQDEAMEFLVDYNKSQWLIKPGYTGVIYIGMWVDHKLLSDPTYKYPASEMFVEYSTTINMPFNQYVQ